MTQRPRRKTISAAYTQALAEHLRAAFPYGLSRPCIGGHYVLGEILGRSAASTVYAASDLALPGRQLVIKVVHPSFRERLEREVHVGAHVRWHGLRPLHDRGVLPDGETPFIVFSRFDGETLAERLERSGPLPWDEALRLGVQLAHVLSGLHERGVIHRDVTPENVLLIEGGCGVLLIDFGNAHVADQPDLVVPGEILGTPRYLAPEQLETPDAIDDRVDVYGLGLTLARAMAGERVVPELESTDAAAVHEALARRPAMRELVPALPPTLAGEIDKALAADREARHASMAELHRGLREVSDVVQTLRTVWRRTGPFEEKDTAEIEEMLHPAREAKAKQDTFVARPSGVPLFEEDQETLAWIAERLVALEEPAPKRPRPPRSAPKRRAARRAPKQPAAGVTPAALGPGRPARARPRIPRAAAIGAGALLVLAALFLGWFILG